MGIAATVGLVVTAVLFSALVVATHLAVALLTGGDPKRPPLRILLLTIHPSVLVIGAFGSVAVITLLRGHWWGLLLLAPAVLHASTLSVRLRRMYR